MTAYRALALQTECHSVVQLDVAGARASMLATIERLQDQVIASKRFIGSDVRLVVLPEYFLSGYPAGFVTPFRD